MKNDEVMQAKRLVSLMEKHSNNAVDNNAITRINQMGTITTIPSDGTHIYTVKIDDDTFQIPARSDLNLSVGNIVIIMCFNGNINQRWIIDKKDWNVW